ncbi:HD domain-containing protein [bacterium]|nr:HD domain-containing protein [bacterium]
MKPVAKKDLDEIKNWFTRYVRLFKNGDQADLLNIVLKEEHTFRVCNEISNIGKKLGLKDQELRLAEMIALLHDVGRFEQYAEYKTFSDRQSVNHARLGMQIIKKHNILKALDDSAEKLVLESIGKHNLPSLPKDEKGPCLFFAKLLRDADKLDIWRVVTDYYSRKDGGRNKAVELDLPDTTGISETVYQDLIHGRIVHADHLRNLNDFKLLQIGWIFDIYFAPTLQSIQSRHYLERIRDVLPKTDEIRNIFDGIRRYLKNPLLEDPKNSIARMRRIFNSENG